MPTRQFALLVVLTAVLLVRAHTGVRAQIVTPGPTTYEFGFSGHLSFVADPHHLFGDQLVNATTFSGWYRFTDPAVNHFAAGGGAVQGYEFDAPAADYQVTIGAVTFQTNPLGGRFLIYAAHNDPYNPDMYDLYTQHASTATVPYASDMIAPGWVGPDIWIESNFSIDDPSKTAMSSSALPTTPPDLSRFRWKGFNVTDDFVPTNQPWFAASGSVDNIWLMNGPSTQAVPEPGPAVVAGACALALGLALLRRARRRTI